MPTRTLPPYANGKIPKSKLAPIPGGKLWLPAANAWNDLVAYVREMEGNAAAASLVAGGPDSSFRPYARQVYWKNYWVRQGQPHKAATPGTSNHGFGIAVDCASALGQKMLRKHGHLFGWSNYEGAAVGEPWHWTFVGSRTYKRRITAPRPIRLTKEEKKYVDLLRAKRRIAKRNGGWSKVHKDHRKAAEHAAWWLRKHATAYSLSKVSDKKYRARKTKFLRDVALNRNGLGT